MENNKELNRELNSPMICFEKRVTYLKIYKIRVNDFEGINFRNDTEAGRIGLNLLQEISLKLDPDTKRAKTLFLKRDLKTNGT